MFGRPKTIQVMDDADLVLKAMMAWVSPSYNGGAVNEIANLVHITSITIYDGFWYA